MSELQFRKPFSPLGFVRNHPLLFLSICFLLSRLIIFITGIERVIWPEEFYRGTIGREIISGLKTNLWSYQADNYDGGSLVIGVFASVVFRLFGDSLMSLKLVPLILSFLTFLSTFSFVEKFFNRRAAVAVGGLLVFPPPTLTALMLVAIGSHPESILFSIGMVYLLYSFLFDPSTNKKATLRFFGLLSGVAFWYTPITFITLLVCLATWCFVDRKSFSLINLFHSAAFFLIGLIPWIAYNAFHGFSGLDFILNVFIPRGMYPTLSLKASAFFMKVLKLSIQTIPFSLFPYPVLGVAEQIFCVLFVLLGGSLFVWHPMVKDKRMFFLFLYPIFFVLIYGWTNFGAYRPYNLKFYQFTYFTPIYFFALILLGILAAQANRRGVYVGLVLLGMLGYSSLVFSGGPIPKTRYLGYSYYDLGTVWRNQTYLFPEKVSEFIAQAEKFPDRERRFLYWGYTSYDNFAWADENRSDEILKIIKEKIPVDVRSYFWEALGNAYSNHEWHNSETILSLSQKIPEEAQEYFFQGVASGTTVDFRSRTVEDNLKDVLLWPEVYRKWFYYDFGRSLQHYYRGLNRLTNLDAAFRQITEGLGEENEKWILRGLGRAAATRWITSKRDIDTSLLPSLNEDEKRNFFWGVGWGIMENILEGRKRGLFWADKVPYSQYKSDVMQGFESFEQFYQIKPKST